MNSAKPVMAAIWVSWAKMASKKEGIRDAKGSP